MPLISQRSLGERLERKRKLKHRLSSALWRRIHYGDVPLMASSGPSAPSAASPRLTQQHYLESDEEMASS